MNELSTWTPLLLVVGLQSGLFYLFGLQSKFCRAASACMAIAITLRYIHWRIFYTIPLNQNPAQQVWAYLFLGAESLGLISAMLLYLSLSRTLDRRPIADARRDSCLLDAPVDVLIVTYNESREILERTIAGALAIDHRDLGIWLLDDGARQWVKELADEMGVSYISRCKGKHAKAGNINNSLKTVLGQVRKPEFLLLLDADFVPNSAILRRTLGLMEEKDVGILQTPQHFLNHDPVQVNLLCTGVWPDEQRFFFNELLPSRDAWGTASCCGTSAVLRVDAITAIGGFATDTVTEDTLTSLKLKEHGYRTIYLNEPLSLGLAPESLREYVTQRSRWCLGSIQQLFTRYAFYGTADISFLDRLSTFDTVLYWMGGAPFKIMMWLGPALYWWTGTSVLRSDGNGLLTWLAPALASNMLFMRFYSGNRVIPIVTDVSQLLSAPTICRTVLQGLLKPFGQPFKVTAKGISTEKTVVHWGLLGPFAVIAIMTAVGMCMNLSGFSPERGAEGFSLNMVWSVVAIAVLCLAILACIERPKRRSSERYQCHEEARVSFWTDDEAEHIACTLTELSLGGAQITLPDNWVGAPPGAGRLALDHGRIQLDFRLVRVLGVSVMAVYFEPTPEVYRALLVKLYTTGHYNLEIEKISVIATLNRLVLTLLT